MSARYTGGLVYNPPGGWSGYFDGSGDYLSSGYSINWSTLGSYTLEFWVYHTSMSAVNQAYASTGGTGYTNFYNYANGRIGLGIQGTNEIVSASGVITANQWYHVAYTYNGTTTTVYVNGVSVASGTTAVYSNNTAALQVGNGLGGLPVYGYMSNFRIVNSVVYTTNFTPPTGALLPITNTSLLTCAYPTFRDGSTNNFTITAVGNAVVSTLNPFPTSQLPNPALGGAGNGVYTMSQYAALKAANLWPAYDPYYRNVTLNLHGNGTNAAQNNTFLDSSTNNFTITRNGNTTQGTFTPYGSNWSNYFDSTSKLSYGTSTNLALGSGDFTIEGWFFPTTTGSQQAIFDWRTAGNLPSNIPVIGKNSSNFITFESTAGTTILTSTNVVSTNTWSHLAIVRQSGTIQIFVNGVASGSVANSTNFGIETFNLGYPSGSSVLVGYWSNIRMVKGTAVYTSAFTPSTAPLTAITNTQLLTCQSNRFRDNSTNAFAITVTGSPSVQRFSPFSPTTAYSTSVIGGSGYFDGTGDYLSVASNDAFRVDQGDWTIEGWVYISTTGSNFTLVNRGVYVSVYSFYCGSSGTSLYYEAGTGGWAATGYTSSSGALVAGQWNHIAYVRSSTSLYMYSNGTRVFSQVVASVGANVTAPMWVGSYLGGSAVLNGNMTDFRFVKGTALYTGSTYTVPTAPLTAVSGTSLLLSYTNAAILDNAMMNDLETVGNAQLSTSVKKYGTGSMYFDGSGDYISAVTRPIYQFGSANFTIEFWFYQNSRTAGEYDAIFRLSGAGTGYNADMYMSIGAGVSGYALAVSNNARNGWSVLLNSLGTLPSLTTWHHMAIVRNGSTWTVYLDGSSVGTATYSGTVNTPTGPFQIGWAGTSDSYWDGYIDDFRVTNGIARYTANFTPPTSQVQDQ